MGVLIIEILLVFFLSKRNSLLAAKKGLKPVLWGFITFVAWLIAESSGFLFAVILFGNTNAVGVFWISITSAFGGYLLVRYILEHKPDVIEDDINKIGVDDLKPPAKPE